MKSQICDVLNIEFPLVAFSHCRDVVAAVSKAGGMGVLRCCWPYSRKIRNRVKLDRRTCRMVNHMESMYLVPNSYVGKGENLTTDDLRAMIPQEHREFRADILEQHDIDSSDLRGDAESQKRTKFKSSIGCRS
jgi:hypothetical protein